MTEGEDEDRGFQPIGSLTREIVRSPRSLALTLEQSPANSATIGIPYPAAKQPGSIGTRHTATPAASTPRGIAAAMASRDPANTDKLILASLPPSVAHSLMPVMNTWVDEYGFDCEIVGYSLTTDPPLADLGAARELVAVAMRPAPAQSVAAELARLTVMTKSRAQSEDVQTLRFAALRDELAEFPQDVISSALRKIARRETFFPSLAEIREQCQREFRHRKLLAMALGA